MDDQQSYGETGLLAFLERVERRESAPFDTASCRRAKGPPRAANAAVAYLLVPALGTGLPCRPHGGD
jgi:hypothetical protein